MSLFDVLTGVIVPHSCLGCAREGQLLCGSCLEKMAAVPERCYRCQAPSGHYLTCADCRQLSDLHSVKVAADYAGTAKALVWKLKLSGARAAAKVMARRLSALVEDGSAIIVPVPTATTRARQRGYDQAQLLARELARQTRLPYCDWLRRSGQTHQHGLPRQERLTQLQKGFRVVRPGAVRGAHIILVDDVVTTGATLEAAAMALKRAGASRIDAVVFAQPQARPEYTIK